MEFEIFKDKKGEWRWRLKARNHKIIAISSEGYKRRASLEKTLVLIRREARNASIKGVLK